MPAVPDLFLFETFDREDWLEAVNLYSPSQLALGRKTSYSVLKGYVPFAKIQAAIAYFLGYSYTGEDNELCRIIPSQHPYIEGLGSFEIPDCQLVKWDQTRRRSALENAVDYAPYTHALMTVAYKQHPYRIAGDGQIWNHISTEEPGKAAGELARFCQFVPTAYVDPAILPGGQLKYDAPSNARVNNRVLVAPKTYLRNQHIGYKLYWYNVPFDFVANEFGEMVKINDCIGKINQDYFMPAWPFVSEGFPGPEDGLPYNTLLLDSVSILNEEIYADVGASLGITVQNGQINARMAGLERRMDLMFDFVYFNPPNAETTPAPVGLPKTLAGARGWRLQPADDGFYYPVKLGDAGVGGLITPDEADFDAMFQHWSL